VGCTVTAQSEPLPVALQPTTEFAVLLQLPSRLPPSGLSLHVLLVEVPLGTPDIAGYRGCELQLQPDVEH
jgi:hypothetical protein